MGAGELREMIAFDKRGAADDGYGNTETTFAEQFVEPARIKARYGGEEVMAARLAGRQPVTITVRYSSRSVLITPEWRARDSRSGDIYNIRAISNPDEKHVYLDILAEKGVAA